MTDPGTTALVRRGSSVVEAPDVSVCVPVLVVSDFVTDCLDSVGPAAHLSTVETVVIANGVSPGDRQVLEDREDIVLVRSGTNLGFAGGNNLAAQVARGRYLLFLNDDSTLADGYIDALVATVEGDPRIAAAGGRILSADGSVQEAGSVLWRDGWATHVGLGLPATSQAYSTVRDVDYVSANGVLVQRDALDATGGFDEGYFPAYYEDVDLCMNFRRLGYRVVYEPRASLRHLESQSTTERFRNFLLIRNRERFVSRWADQLEQFDPRPEPIDAAAVHRAVNRAVDRAATSGRAGPPEPHSQPTDRVDRAEPAAPEPSDQQDREQRAAWAAVEVGLAYRRWLEVELDRTTAALDETTAALDETTIALDETKAALEEGTRALDETKGALDRTTEALDSTRTVLDETVAELGRVQAELATKNAYIDALPSVRLKAWVADRQGKPKK